MHRWRKPVLFVFVFFLIYFLSKELTSQRDASQIQDHTDVRWKADDEITAIRYYHKHKLFGV